MTVEIDIEATQALEQKKQAPLEIDFEATQAYLSEGERWAYPGEYTLGKQTALAVAEIAPAIAGSIWGGWLGGGAGAAGGNWLSQKLRNEWRLQYGINPGELAAGTAAAMVPVGKLLQYGTAARIATRTGQGVLLSEAELAGRTILDEGRLPSEQEVKMAALFGGVIGGGMGAIEAKWFNKHLSVGKEGDTRDELANQLTLEIKNRGPVGYLESHPVAKELLGTKEPFTLKYPIVPYARQSIDPSSLKPEELAFEILDATEENILRVANATPVADLPPVQPALAGRDTPLLEYGGLAKQNIERVKQQKQLSQEVFLPDVDYEKIHHTLREELHEALFEWEKWKARPPRKRGKKEGARFKKNLEAAKKKVLQAHRNRLKNLGLDPDLEAKMRARQLPSLDQPVEAMPKVDRPMRQASEKLNKYDQMAEDYYGEAIERIDPGGKHGSKFYSALAGGALPAGSMAAYLSDEDGDMSKASLLSLIGLGIVAAALGGGVQALRRRPGFPSYGKTKASQKVKSKDVPTTVQVDRIKGAAADDGAYKPPSSLRKTWDSVSEWGSDKFSLLSRRAKKIHPQIAAALRKPFLDINKDLATYKKKALPFFQKLQAKAKSPDAARELMRAFLNANTRGMGKLRELAETYGIPEKELDDAIEVFKDIHTRLREEAGVDLGKIEDYLPRVIGDYKSFRKFLDESPLFREQKTTVEKALKDYAVKQKYQDVDSIPEAEKAIVTTRVLEGRYPGIKQTPQNVQSREFLEVNDQMLAAYLKPVESIEKYLDSMVRHLHINKALGKGLTPRGEVKVEGEGFKDTFRSDLGIAAKVEDTVAYKMSRALAEEHGFANRQDKIEELSKIVQATFDPTPVPSLIQGIKTATYLQTLTNLGSAITQFGEVAYSMHFYGLSNTFRSAYRNKFNRDFYSDLGLNRHDADMATTAGGMQGVLDKLFDWMQFSKMDKWAKNTTMNAAWKSLHQRARGVNKNGSKNEKLIEQLKAELTLKFGNEKATRMLRDLQEIKPSMTAKLTDDLEEVIFNEISDLSPITRMEQAAAHRGTASIFYTLKSFGLKQIDIYREAAGEHILEARRLYSQGDHKAAANEAFKGVKALTSLGVLFAAANASTDVVKDAIYGRPIKTDDLVWDNIMKLFLVNRYFKYKYQREGLGKAGLELFLPATPVFDRAGKDITDMMTFQDIKGHTLQGTPFDLAYWWWLGGRDKIEKQYDK